MRAYVTTCNVLHVGPTLAGITILVTAVVGSLLHSILTPEARTAFEASYVWGTAGGTQQQSYFSSIVGPQLCVPCLFKRQHAM